MAKLPFNKKLEKHCEYCVHGTRLKFEDEIICKKHGVTSCDDKCRSYKYDPLKRIPQRVKIENNFTEEDFKL